MRVDKVIVTNLTALRQKYEAAGVKTIQAAVKDLIAADKQRGLTTMLVALDDAAGMKKLKAPPVKDATDLKQNKKAIDGVYKALVPDYLLILGAIDVVPHQDVKNPLYSPPPTDGDDDEFAYSDLPYACDAPYSQDVNDFTGPTRVVGRLPDLTGATGSPKYLLGLLKTATKWQSRPRSEYQNYLGISAEKWRASTAESLMKIFNSDKDLQTSPKRGYKWRTPLVGRRVHFINCHGGKMIPDFYGQSGTDDDDMPISHQAAYIAQTKLPEGTVAAAECCYGGQLYDPSGAENGQMGMCNTYLNKKAYGFFASTTTAYGPASGTDQADLICQYFLQRVLGGASLGRAALEARHRFIEKTAPLNLKNQKTLAQFNLFGDPSITAVAAATSKLAVGSKIVHLTTGVSVGGVKGSKAVHLAGAAERTERRGMLRAKGTLLAQMQPAMTKTTVAPSKQITASLRKMASRMNLKHVDTISFHVHASVPASSPPQDATAKGIMKAVAAKQQDTTAFYVFVGAPQSSAANVKGVRKGAGKQAGAKGGAAADGGATPKKPPIRQIVVLEAKEVGGNIVISEGHSK